MKKILFAVMLIGIARLALANASTGLEKLTACSACHGPAGISNNPLWPNLAGQHVNYFQKQLRDYQSGLRKSLIMSPIAASLNEEEIVVLANFYAKKSLPQGKTPQAYLQLGEKIYRRGEFSKHITACIACHGPRGTGNSQAGFPVLTGQQAAYTIQQLQFFKEKKRSNDLNSIMQDISKRMSLEDMQAVAYYIQGLH